MTLEELEKRTRALEEINEIEKLHRSYVICLDNHEWDKLMDCFAEDSTVKIGSRPPATGKEAIAKFFKDDIGKSGMPAGGHVLEHPVITVEGDKAKGYWTMYRLLYYFVEPKNATEEFMRGRKEGYPGRYDCEYTKEGGKWKFSYLLWTHNWPE
jgi:ketosteroid isomerase-like protein